ncbi:MAG: hypothetical protein JRH13_09970 [Deltaproteobacteria bacterium]|nr:hypothetical protein [Deltaproteobacteria bacterium]MBW2017242.1 hypothetical protein [Deltaproteobacteria bacterium]MBW2129678.1 hypothetical protein [Deltaproteobacteria bacterium]MBW2304766.1 hypothetical protein [Deltaproteobacteria bacterium]
MEKRSGKSHQWIRIIGPLVDSLRPVIPLRRHDRRMEASRSIVTTRTIGTVHIVLLKTWRK